VTFTYVCAQFPGMESCPAALTTAGEEELWQPVEMHARLAHDEDPGRWSDEDREQITAIIAANSTG